MSYVDPCYNSIVIPPVTMAEVRQTILSLKNSSAGWDDFPALVAKQSIESYIEPLTCLINRSFLEGIFPTELKLARVIPIFKSGDSASFSNYRPISILSFFAKIYEKLLYISTYWIFLMQIEPYTSINLGFARNTQRSKQ